MPDYIYRCPKDDCLYHKDTIQLNHSMKECDKPHYCPLCASKQIKSEMERQPTSFSFPTDAKPDPIKLKFD